MKKKDRISLHPIRDQWYVESEYEYQVDAAKEFLMKVGEKPFLLTSYSDYALIAGTNDLIRFNDKSKFLEYLRSAHLASVFHWKGMSSPDEFTVKLPNRPDFKAGPIKSNASVNFGSWLNGIYIAMILRDIPAVQVYGEADPEKIVRYSGKNKPDAWEIPYIKFLNGIWGYDTELLTYMKAAMVGTDPSLYNIERVDYLLNILVPLMEVWIQVFAGTEESFNATLFRQQKIRHDWHVALDEDTGNSIMEYIDLGALAATCYAHDKGFKINIQSDYLPEFLIKGDFPKLEWPNPDWQE